MILLLFDVSKLDISDEFRRVILACSGNDHKISILLNKADGVSTQQLMRCYGALMWSLGKVIDTPEVSRVYVGSFWDEPLKNENEPLKNENLRELFEKEENDLYTRIAQLPRTASVRKVNDLIKRARLAKVHAILLDISTATCQASSGIEISVVKGLPLGDFPDPRMMQKLLSTMDFSTFKPLNADNMKELDNLLSVDLPKLLQLIPEEQSRLGVSAAAVSQVAGAASPFAVMKENGNTEQSVYQGQWMVAPNVDEYKAEFEALEPNAGKITGQQARDKMIESHLPSNVLHRIWSLADVDKDGFLTLPEYALAMHLVHLKLEGQDVPATLPDS
eukprot:CAMPEP_0115140116 /NCGR_PEP_ID=MMETSP0227-20121206/58728_1 /TAXON_ID=89957 /ORGANISM="Polarella glacialis, Strain CCMP 1383" /LENGTH=332 /DNA_ID=CAMNT_0002548181 /DNA_START=141 /DNA_END=1137 /DNA_ORIENTATION=+